MASRATLGAASAPTLPLDVLLSAIPSLPRPLLSRLTARLIEHLDQVDGDPDLEDGDEDRCAARDDDLTDFSFVPAGSLNWPIVGVCEDDEDDDPAGGNVLDEPHDHHENLRPLYGVDQSAGPINGAQAVREYQRAQLVADWAEHDRRMAAQRAGVVPIRQAIDWHRPA